MSALDCLSSFEVAPPLTLDPTEVGNDGLTNIERVDAARQFRATMTVSGSELDRVRAWLASRRAVELA